MTIILAAQIHFNSTQGRVLEELTIGRQPAALKHVIILPNPVTQECKELTKGQQPGEPPCTHSRKSGIQSGNFPGIQYSSF